ncbi:PKD domain-containing protein [Colwellia hornerae]|uniref:PKD/Chitinase domain-containing protein n=1 Tax=Colwellia hornerae TaxID=89402 RepID=A0A5C6QN89_9GAMM|nr:hypothetical protein [Colwellia hornerae]TWX53664.1 hypothetical protein ESZ28_09290 [Colwellia hornerae]TWX60314.1 hypothetical protein ESZ26_08065 [Colwellia hornerae]TWX70070.1 hypothetical protein ESZ27_04755 [Colwellia hornerae]
MNKLVVFFGILIFLNGCGGGSSSTSSATTKNNVPVVSLLASNQTIFGLDTIELSGTATDADGDLLSYVWKQTSPMDTAVDLSQVNGSGSFSIRIPDVAVQTTFTFTLAVSDGKSTSTKSINIVTSVLPPFSLSLISHDLQVNEFEEAIIKLHYENARGEVSLSTILSGDGFVNDETTVVKKDGSQGIISLTINNVLRQMLLSLTITATDSVETVSVVEIQVEVFNTSILRKIAMINVIKNSYDAILNAEEERKVIESLSNLAFYSGEVAFSEKNNFIAKVGPMFDQNLALLIRAEFDQFETDQQQYINEELVDLKLVSFHANMANYIEPINAIIAEVSILSNTVELTLGDYYFIEQDNILSQFWGNSSLGSQGDKWAFSNDFQYLTDVIFPDDQICTAVN